MFTVGMKVTPKNSDPWWDEGDGDIYPQFGVVYTVRAFEFIDGEDFIWLNEIINSPADYEDGPGEISWHADEFRPVVERKASTETGFAILDEIRRKATKKRKAGASA